MILREIKNMYIKNRLTEGVDFVRKEWLVQGGGGIIDTKIKDLTNFSTIKLHYLITGNTSPSRIFGRDANEPYRCLVLINATVINTSVYAYNAVQFTNNAREQVVTFDFANQRVSINDVIKTLQISKNNHDTKSLTVFGSVGSASNTNGLVGVQFAEVTFTTTNGDILHLTPCQLLKSIPATLDANNRARSAGECGMYDSISGKFYGNVASTGTFTVEGDVEPETHTGLQQIYQNKLIEGEDYETYDWLKGDGEAYIDTLLKPSSSLETQIKFVFSYGLESIPRNTGAFGSCVKEPGWRYAYSRYWINYDNKFEIGYDDYVNTGYITESGSINEIDFNYIEDNVHKFRINNEVYTVSGSPNSTINMVLFGKNVGGYDIFTSKINISYCRFIESNITIAEFIPCQLLRSIPRNLDAQCKERVAGECGMIDLISGKFYGNVANSGTFTVENDNN